MIRYFRKEQGQLLELEQFAPGCWVHISTPFSSNELEDFAEKFDIELDYLTDSLDPEERSRYEKEDHFRFILINTPIPNQREDDYQPVFLTVPIGILFAEQFMITISAFDNTILDLFLKDKVRHFNPSDYKLFILQILDQNVNRFTSYLKKLNLNRDVIEQQLINSSRNNELKQLLGLEKSAVYFVNALSSNELLKLKLKRTDFLGINGDEDKVDFFENIIIDNNQAHQMANVFTNIINGTTDAMASIISNNLNVIIQRWTMITIVLMVPTLVASFYGMNVAHLPFADSQYSFFYVVLFSILITLPMVWVMKRRELF